MSLITVCFWQELNSCFKNEVCIELRMSQNVSYNSFGKTYFLDDLLFYIDFKASKSSFLVILPFHRVMS